MKNWKLPTIEPQWKETMETYKYVLLVIGIGLIFLLLPDSNAPIETQLPSTELHFQLQDFEQHLAENLSYIAGAGETQVVLTLKNNGEVILAQDTQEEYHGKITKDIVTIGSGANEQVVEIKQYYPEFQGALIICTGGDNAQVKLELIQAVSALTGLRSDNISVCKSEQ